MADNPELRGRQLPTINDAMVLRGRPVPNEPWVMPVPGWQDYGPGYVPNTSIPVPPRPVPNEPWLMPMAQPASRPPVSRRVADFWGGVMRSAGSAPPGLVVTPYGGVVDPAASAAPAAMAAPARPVDQQPAVQFRERGKAGGISSAPTSSSAPMPSTPMTMGQALKFLALTKPLTPVEQAQTALLDRAAQQKVATQRYLEALDPKKVTDQILTNADQRQRNNLLDVLGLGNFQNVMAGQMAGRGFE